MRKSPTILPNRPSIGMAFIQRKCPGSSASRAGTKISIQIPPRTFATGEETLRERNQRTPSTAEKTGSRNAPIPKPCKTRSEITAPTTPIQLRAAREPVSTEALFSDGSSGEYEANARKRRSAEMHKRNPTSSFSRRLLVGAKICERYLIGDLELRRNELPLAVPDLCQSLSIMTRTGEPYNSGFGSGIQSDKHNLCHQAPRKRQHQWRSQSLSDYWRCHRIARPITITPTTMR